MIDHSLADFFKAKSKSEGSYAIAYALVELAQAQYQTAAAIQRLGNGNANTDMGAIENLGMQVEKVAQAISDHAIMST